MKLSVVTTLYHSQPHLREFHARISAAALAVTYDYEIILVNDGSPDDALGVALDLQAEDSRVVVVDLSRNFGHHKAMMTGLGYATGEQVFLIDCDLEEEPELLTGFHERLRTGDCDVVYGVQNRRRGGLIQRMTGDLFYYLVERLSDRPLPRNLVTARLMTRPYVRALLRHRDRDFLIAELWAATGFRQVALKIDKGSFSPSTYSLAMRLNLALRYMTTNSTRLLTLVFWLALGVWGLSVVAIIYLVGRYLVGGIGVSGWTSLIVTLWFFGGLIVLGQGLIGIYIASILTEAKRRPNTIVRQVYGRDPS
ncbi:glycosyltransferase family 2 protein [soil metagenome]